MDIKKQIFEYSLEEVMSTRFKEYSKYIIQERAIPDARDGLKPVQRRILYSMYKDKNTFDKPYRKSAKTVGNVMGNYHPHGDSSIYDAMIRMAQWWKQNTTYIDIHGNHGSRDGDDPAAMRYTEARLSKISNELLKDLERDTVEMALNFDDTELEPTVLPAKFPNLLVNGAAGIAAGYATNIPPHNLEEVIDSAIFLINNPEGTTEDILRIMKGPDFPTGGIVDNKSDILKIFETGKGRISLRGRHHFKKIKGKKQIIISEIPFEVNKANLVKKIDDIRLNKEIAGILEVRDESDKDGLSIVIDLKSSASEEVILKYLLKKTDLKINYNYNMVAIKDRVPKQMGVVELLNAYNHHLKDVILRRTQFDLKHALARMHIIEGLIKCLSILDSVIQVIRSSKNKKDAINNLVEKFSFSEKQAEAIVMLQLYRLTNTDVLDLEKEAMNLKVMIEGLEKILNDEKMLKNVLINEMKRVKKEYGTPRKTTIQDEEIDLTISIKDRINEENCILLLSKDGYVKRSSLRSYQALDEEIFVKDGDYPLYIKEVTNLDYLVIFTNLGNYINILVNDIPNVSWKDMGTHFGNLINLEFDEEIVGGFTYKAKSNIKMILMTRFGMTKVANTKQLKTANGGRKGTIMGLNDKDNLLKAEILDATTVSVVTKNNQIVRFETSKIPEVGLNAKGVIGIKLKGKDEVVDFCTNSAEFLILGYENGNLKRMPLEEIDVTNRNTQGVRNIRDVKSNPFVSSAVISIDIKDELVVISDDIETFKVSQTPLCDRNQSGSKLVSKVISLKKRPKNNVEEISLFEIDKKLEEF